MTTTITASQYLEFVDLVHSDLDRARDYMIKFDWVDQAFLHEVYDHYVNGGPTYNTPFSKCEMEKARFHRAKFTK